MLTSILSMAQDTVHIYNDSLQGVYENGLNSTYRSSAYDELIVTHTVILSADSMKARREQKKYSYNKNLDSVLKAWKLDEEKKFSKEKKINLPGGSFFNIGIVKIIVWIIALGFIGFILFHLFKNQGLFSRDKKSSSGVESLTEEEIFYQNDYDKLIHQALLLGDVRVATRYYFLKTLYRLNEKSLIEFAIDKTNLKYYYELPAALKPDFLQLSKYYEFVWYGNVAITNEQFKTIETMFTQFLQKI